MRGPSVPDGALLGATIEIGSATGSILTWKFHAPGDRHVTKLEGISGPGDSGGPAYLGKLGCVAGISSHQSYEIDPTKPPTEEPQGRYGAIETYTRVSAYVGWISQTLANN